MLNWPKLTNLGKKKRQFSCLRFCECLESTPICFLFPYTTSLGSKFFSFRVDQFSEDSKNKFDRAAPPPPNLSLKVYQFPIIR